MKNALYDMGYFVCLIAFIGQYYANTRIKFYALAKVCISALAKYTDIIGQRKYALIFIKILASSVHLGVKTYHFIRTAAYVNNDEIVIKR